MTISWNICGPLIILVTCLSTTPSFMLITLFLIVKLYIKNFNWRLIPFTLSSLETNNKEEDPECVNYSGLTVDRRWSNYICPSLSVLFDLSSRLSSWQAAVYPTLGLKPPLQSAPLISLIINQYAAGSPSGEDFTQRWHLFSTNTARDEEMEGGENKDISDSCYGWSMVLCRGIVGWIGLCGNSYSKFTNH